MFAEKEIITKRKINRFHLFILLIKIYAVVTRSSGIFFFFFFGGVGLGKGGRQEIEYFALNAENYSILFNFKDTESYDTTF